MKRSLPPLPEKGSKEKLNPDQQQTWKNISRIENKLIKMDQRLTLELSSATDLLGKIESMHTGVTGYLPDLWQTYYFSVPSRFFDPVAWEGITERWEKTLQNMNLRMSIEFPRNPSAWKGVGLRFLNVLLLGCVVIFFVNRRMVRAEKKGTMPTAARSGILRSLLWQFTGLALVGGILREPGRALPGAARARQHPCHRRRDDPRMGYALLHPRQEDGPHPALAHVSGLKPRHPDQLPQPARAASSP